MRKIELVVFLILSALNSQAQMQKATVRLNSSTVLTLEKKPFKASGKVFKYYENKQPNTSKFLIAINGKPVFGADGEMPKYTLTKATLLLKGHYYNLLIANMYNPWFEEEPNAKSVRLHKTGSDYRLEAVFSDGAGTYLAEWRISGNIAKRVLLTTEDELTTGFYQRAKQ